MAENNDTNQLNDEASPKDDEEIIDLTEVVSDTENIDDIELPDYTDETIRVAEEEVHELDEDILDDIVQLEDDLELDNEYVDSADFDLELDVSEDKKQDLFIESEEEADNLEQLIADVVEDTPQKIAHEDETASNPPEPIPLSSEQVDEALERVIKKMYADKIDSILHEAIKKTVTKEIERLKALLLNNTNLDKE